MALETQTVIHSTAVAINGHGVIILGPSGAGKSDLAIRLIDRGAILVSDDQTIVSRIDDNISLSPPERIAGQIELYSIGIHSLQYIKDVQLEMIVELTKHAERFPMDNSHEKLLDVQFPKVKIDPQRASAPIKVEMALKKIMESRKLT